MLPYIYVDICLQWPYKNIIRKLTYIIACFLECPVESMNISVEWIHLKPN